MWRLNLKPILRLEALGREVKPLNEAGTRLYGNAKVKTQPLCEEGLPKKLKGLLLLLMFLSSPLRNRRKLVKTPNLLLEGQGT